jgi:putative inorganic carbon (hco3(-)) transporter
MRLLSGPGALVLAALPVLVVLGYLAVGWFEAFVLAALLVRSALEYADTAVPGAQLTTLFGAGFTIVALVWLAVQQGDRQRLSPFARAALVFAAAGVLGVVISPEPGVSLGILARLLSFAVVAVALERLLVAHPDHVRHLLVAVLASSALPILITVHQVTTGNGLQLIDGFLRASGTFVHPNEFAIYLSFLMVMEAALVLTLRGRLRWLLGGLLVASGFSLLHTYTRGAWIAVAAGLFVVGLLHSRATVVLLGIAGIAVLVLVPSVRGRFDDIVQPQPDRTEWGAPANSLVWRLGHWSDAIVLARHDPATGLGLGMVNADTQLEAHNDYVRAYTEGGIIGLAAYLWLLQGLLRNVVRSLRDTEARTIGRAVAVGFAGCAAAFLVISITDNVITSLAEMWYFAALAAASTAAAVHWQAGKVRKRADLARQ